MSVSLLQQFPRLGVGEMLLESQAAIGSLHWRLVPPGCLDDREVAWQLYPPDGRTLAVNQCPYLIGWAWARDLRDAHKKVQTNGGGGLELAIVVEGRLVVINSDEDLERIFRSFRRPLANGLKVKYVPGTRLKTAMRYQFERHALEALMM